MAFLYYGSEFVNETLIQYCLSHGIELTRSRPWRKNDQAWIEQKNGAVVRKLLGYRRFQGIAAAQAITRLYGASRLFVNFFQPSFKLAEKHREGAQVTKRYHPPQTPCERLLQAQSIPDAAKSKLREVANALDPLKLLEEIRAVQAHLAALADGEQLPSPTPEPPDLSAFVASLSSAWRAGETRPAFSIEAKPRYLRSLQGVIQRAVVQTQEKTAVAVTQPAALILHSAPIEKAPERPQLIYAERGTRAFHALNMVWPLVCWRLERALNIASTQLFEELCAQYPGRFHPWQDRRLMKRVKTWREEARARGVIIGPRKHRYPAKRAPGGGRAPQSCAVHWAEMVQWLEEHPDSTGVKLLTEFQTRYPGCYNRSHLRTLRRRLGIWRRQTIQRLICELKGQTQDVSVNSAEQSCAPDRSHLSNPELLPALRAGKSPSH